ncbi:MAG: NAD(P)/FAD-dependent oxidoreductase [Candidatus Thorarchaeota archaeon]
MADEDLNWEVVVIGGGPAGMTAAIYAARYGLKTILIESKVLGGAQATSPGIENYPGFEFIVGLELATKMKAQVKKSGAIIKEITEVKSITRPEDCGDFILETRRGDYHAQAVIFATGGGHKHLNVPGEYKFTGRGVSFCATCDGPLFRNKKVAVVGGGNTAAIESVYLSEVTQGVHLIHRRDELRAEKAMQDLVFQAQIEIMWSHIVKEFRGEDLLKEVVLEDLKTGKEKVLEVDGFFVALGASPESKMAIELGVKVNENGEIFTDGHQATNIPGFFAAGDVVESMKQITVAVGHGAIAADSAYRYIKDVKATQIRGYA